MKQNQPEPELYRDAGYPCACGSMTCPYRCPILELIPPAAHPQRLALLLLFKRIRQALL